MPWPVSLCFLGVSVIALAAAFDLDASLRSLAYAADSDAHGGTHEGRGSGPRVGGHDSTGGTHGGTSGDDHVTHGDDHDGGHDRGGDRADRGRGGRSGDRGPGTDALSRGRGGEALHGSRGSGVEHDGGEEDSDRPAWAGKPGRADKPGRGNAEAGTSKGEIYGDLYVVLRNPDGTPVLDANGNVVLVGSDGSLIHKTAEGEIPPDKLDLVQEVELGRLNVGRSPDQVLDARRAEAVSNLNSSDGIVVIDATGRLSYVAGGEVRTIDSPLENLGLYIELMNTGTIEGLDPEKVSPDLRFLVDDRRTTADVAYGAVLLAAAADKTATVTVDQVVYLNRIIEVTGNGPITFNGESYFDFTGFSYDRFDTWGDVVASVLVHDAATDSWKTAEVDVYEQLFGGTNATGGNAVGFAQAANDALQVIEFVHDYETAAVPGN